MKLRRAEGRLLVVVHHEHSQLAHASPAGNFARTVVPSPGAFSAGTGLRWARSPDVRPQEGELGLS